MLSSKDKKSILEWLILQRNLKGITQEQLATLLKKPQSYISKYESGERKLGLYEFIEICKIMKVDPSTQISRLINDKNTN